MSIAHATCTLRAQPISRTTDRSRKLTKRHNELEMRRFDKTPINACANCKHITNLGLQEWF